MDHLAPSPGVNWFSYNTFGEELGGSQLPPMELEGLDFGCHYAYQLQCRESNEIVGPSSLHYSQEDGSFTLTDNVVVSQQDVLSSIETENLSTPRSALGEKIMCNICGATFACGANLRNHLRIHTGERPFVCEECGASFTQRSNLRTHKRVHTGERPYMCGICGQTFARSSHLPGHMRSHTGEKPFSCPHCFRSFATNQIMKNHLRTHTGERPFTCEVCDATFAQSSVLATHKKIHTGERNYKCSLCSKAFISRSGQQTHERVHTGEKPYPCEKCHKSFKTSSYLSKHKQRYCGNTKYKNKQVKIARKSQMLSVCKSDICVKSVDKPSIKFVSNRTRHFLNRKQMEDKVVKTEILNVKDGSNIDLKMVNLKVNHNFELRYQDIECPETKMGLSVPPQYWCQENQDIASVELNDYGCNTFSNYPEDSGQITRNSLGNSEQFTI